MDFRPFRPFRPHPDHAQSLITPPYDVLSGEEVRSYVGENRDSFLRVTRADFEFPPDADSYADAVYEKARRNFCNQLETGRFVHEDKPVFGIYRQTLGAHTQIGLVGLAAVEDYRSEKIKKHEFTRPDKEDDRTRHIAMTEAQTGPVFLAIQPHAELQALLVQASQTAPELDVWMPGGVRHEAWYLDAESPLGQAITAALATVKHSYIADGHHRAASASRVSALRREEGHGPGPWDHLLAVLFPSPWLQIMAYNRVIADLGGLAPAEILRRLEASFTVEKTGKQIPGQPHEISLYLDAQWWTLRPHTVVEGDPIASLDVSIVQDQILAPILGITDPRTDARLEFVGGIRGTALLEELAGAQGMALSLYPTSIEALFAVADHGAVMPPKSTWFEPKLADGLFVHSIAESPPRCGETPTE